jgi:hypothetical protein
MPQSWNTGQMFYFPSKGRHAEDFFNRSGANPRSWVPEASMLTTRPPKPLKYVILNPVSVKYILFLCNSVFPVLYLHTPFSFVIFLGTECEMLTVVRNGNVVWV